VGVATHTVANRPIYPRADGVQIEYVGTYNGLGRDLE
jgi:hypothetical protein